MSASDGQESLQEYDRHLGAAASSALAGGETQLAALLADCAVQDVAYLDTAFALDSQQGWEAVAMTLSASAVVAERFSEDLVEAARTRINNTLTESGEYVASLRVMPPVERDGWRERTRDSLGEQAPDSPKDLW